MKTLLLSLLLLGVCQNSWAESAIQTYLDGDQEGFATMSFQEWSGLHDENECDVVEEALEQGYKIG